MLLFWLLTFVANFALIFSQAIPYSYASGRDVAAVEDRYNRFQAARANNASPNELMNICGRVDLSQQQCFTQVGRPRDSESLACDSLCCLAGQKVGNCGSSYGVQLNFNALLGVVAGGPLGVTTALGALNPSVTANCHCSDDPTDVRCGLDGSVGGVRCPFDNSACWRKCCREGRSGGSCGGFLRLRCRCN